MLILALEKNNEGRQESLCALQLVNIWCVSDLRIFNALPSHFTTENIFYSTRFFPRARIDHFYAIPLSFLSHVHSQFCATWDFFTTQSLSRWRNKILWFFFREFQFYNLTLSNFGVQEAVEKLELEMISIFTIPS